MQQILSHTPLYVWAILGFLAYRGLIASQDRETTLRKMCLMPAAMLLLSLQGIHSSFGLAGAAPLLWACGALLGSLLSWHLAGPAPITVDTARGTIVQRGSWLPLILMLTLFCTKYAVGVTQAMHPELRHALPFMASVATLYGVFSGLFAGGLLRRLAVYRRAINGFAGKIQQQAA